MPEAAAMAASPQVYAAGSISRCSRGPSAGGRFPHRLRTRRQIRAFPLDTCRRTLGRNVAGGCRGLRKLFERSLLSFMVIES